MTWSLQISCSLNIFRPDQSSTFSLKAFALEVNKAMSGSLTVKRLRNNRVVNLNNLKLDSFHVKSYLQQLCVLGRTVTINGWQPTAIRK